VSRRFLFLSVVVAFGGVACTSGGSQQSLPQQSSAGIASHVQAVSKPLFASAVLPSTSGTSGAHYLYVASSTFGKTPTSNVYLYKLPLTPTSTPSTEIEGFSEALDVKVGTENINVLDNGAKELVIYYASPSSGEMQRCTRSLGFYGAALAIYSTDLLMLPVNPFDLTQYANGDGHGTPMPCNGEAPTTVTGGTLTNTHGVAADDKFVYVSASGELTAYAKPLHSGESPDVTDPCTCFSFDMAVTKTDLFATYSDGTNEIADYKLPLTSTTSPTTVALPACSGMGGPWGVAVYPLEHPTELFVTQDCPEPTTSIDTIYEFTLPLSASSKPAVSVPIGYAAYGIDAR
jgi:hypothetical protein